MQKQEHGVLAIAGVYVGTVVGAGFATGQEVMRFFTFFGLNGIWGVLGATVLFAVLGAAILQVAYRVRAESHREVFNEVTGPLVGGVLDWVVAFFLFAGASIMMAGSGAVFAEHWGLSRGLGTALMAAISVGTVLLGLRGVVASISAVAPILIGMVLLISGWTFFSEGIAPTDLAGAPDQQPASPYWPVSALLYVSYNLLLAISVLAPLGGIAKDEAKLRLGGLIGGVALGVGALAINLALVAGLPESTRFEVPMLHLAEALPPWVKSVYSVILWAEIYTTAVSSLFGLAVRFAPKGNQVRFRWITLGAGAGALLLSQIGFSRMVAFVFPVVGWLGLVFIAALLIRLFQRERARV